MLDHGPTTILLDIFLCLSNPHLMTYACRYKLCVTAALGCANNRPLKDVYCNINMFQPRLQLQLQAYTFIHMFAHLPIPLTNIYNIFCQTYRTQSYATTSVLYHHISSLSSLTFGSYCITHLTFMSIYHHRVKLSQMINKPLYTGNTGKVVSLSYWLSF